MASPFSYLRLDDLTKENKELKAEVERLKEDNAAKDKTIKTLAAKAGVIILK